MLHSEENKYFIKGSKAAISDKNLRKALRTFDDYAFRRKQAVSRVPHFQGMRKRAQEIREHTLDNLDIYLQIFEQNLLNSGGQLHWCNESSEVSAKVVEICNRVSGKKVVKGKSMISEEVGLNDALVKADIDVLETDLGEYIIQLAGQKPSHIIAPSMHMTKEQVEELFRKHHTWLDAGRNLESAESMVTEAREVLREKYFSADVGITGANFLIAENGSCVLVTNEGNGDLCLQLPKTNIIIASIEKIVPTVNDAMLLLRLLSRSATGQDISVYTTFINGRKRPNDVNGSESLHVILLDGGRSSILSSSMKSILRCIKCGACLGHCPVFCAIGGHAYNSPYSGPMGSVYSPSLFGTNNFLHLPHASSSCGKCDEVCPVKIPLTSLMRQLRTNHYDRKLIKFRTRVLLSLWNWLCLHPLLYKTATLSISLTLIFLSGSKGYVLKVPLLSRWSIYRVFPKPQIPRRIR